MRPILFPLLATLLPGSLAYRKHRTFSTVAVGDAVSVASAQGNWVVVPTTFSTLTKRSDDSTSTDSTSTETSTSTTKTKKSKTKTTKTSTTTDGQVTPVVALDVETSTDTSETETETTKTTKTTKTKTTKTKTTKTTSETASATPDDDEETTTTTSDAATATGDDSDDGGDGDDGDSGDSGDDDDDSTTTTSATSTKTTETSETETSDTATSTKTTKTTKTKTSETSATATETSAAINAATTTSSFGNSTTTAASAATATAAAAAGVGATKITTLAGGSGVGGTTCTVTAFSDVTASVSACSNILLSGITVPASSTLSVTVPTSGALLFAGTLTVEYTPDSEYTPIVLKGSYAKVAGLAGAVLDGQGAQYWDGEGSNGGTDKPDHFIKISDMVSSSFSDITIQNWPTHLFEITGCTDMTLTNLILDNSAGDETDSDGDALGHNTDAFDVSSTDGLYVSSATVYNQDDCVAVNSGSNMVFENLYCSGGHGLSIGSVDSDVTISNITFQDSTVIDSANGCRIKTDADGTDSTVSDITYSNIYLSGITKYGIDVQQDYENGSPTGDPTTGITVSGVTFSSITGTVSDSDAYDYYILCGSTSSCTDFTWTDVSITGGTSSCSPSGDICPSS